MRDKVKQPSLIKGSFRELMKDVCTSVPGHIVEFNPSTQLAQVRVGVERVDINGSTWVLEPIIQTPVHMPGGDWCLEYEVHAGTEGCILFSQRCIDGWLNTGGVGVNPHSRFHHMQDALFIPGFRPVPGALPAFANNGIRMRNKSGTQFAWLKADGSIVVENGAGHIRLGADGTVTINGVTITPDGLVTSPNDVVAKDISLTKHRTSGVTGGNQTSGVPVV